MASIKEVGDLQWKVQIRRKGYPNQYDTFKTKKEAQVWARQIESEMDRGVFVSRSEAERVTLGELIQRYRDEVLPGKRGKHFSPALNAIEARLGEYSLTAITSKIINNYKRKRLESVSTETVRKEINLLSVLFDLAEMEWGMPLPVNPCDMVARPAPGEARERRLEGDEYARLLAACEPHVSALVQIAVETGARLGELLAVRWTDIDLVKQVMIVRGIDGRGTKNKDASRAVPLSTSAVAVFERLKTLPDSSNGLAFFWWSAADGFNKTWGRVKIRAQIQFLTDSGKEHLIPTDYINLKHADEDPKPTKIVREKRKTPVSAANLKNPKVAKAKRIDVDQLSGGFLSDLRFHDLRHEATSRLFELGTMNVMEIAMMTGHKNLQSLKRYTHLRAEDLAKKLG